MTKYLIVVIVALVAALWLQSHRLDTAQADHAKYVSDVAVAAQVASEKARETERKAQATIEEVRTNANTQKAEDDSRIDRLNAVGVSLRDEQSRLLADKASLVSRLAERGKTINDLIDLLAGLRNEADEYAGELASALTASRRAGFACEASYNAIVNPVK